MSGSTVRKWPWSSSVCALQEVGQLGDLGIGDAGVGFADVEQFAGAGEVGAAHGEGVVAEQAGALAVAVLGAGDDDVERGEFALQLDPREAAAAGLVDGVGGLDHHAFVGAGAGGGVGAVDVLGALDQARGREQEAREGSC